ncbi:MAG TPA: ribulose-phosphate 3-epimerase [bacterium]|nr:ribulose-phosphate 3-epimerase [bacterium]
MNNYKQIVPSLLSADFAILEKEIRDVEKSGAQRLHLDVMDGHFVPNITFGPIIVKAIRKLTDCHLETHLMISEPEKYLKQFIEAGSDTLLFQVEVGENISENLARIRELGAKPGLVINPPTEFEKLKPFLDKIDHLLIMTVNPGFGGQKLIMDVIEKIKRARPFADKYDFRLEVDGGVNLSTIDEVVKAGADLFVAGSAVFGGANPGQNFQQLEQRIRI